MLVNAMALYTCMEFYTDTKVDRVISEATHIYVLSDILIRTLAAVHYMSVHVVNNNDKLKGGGSKGERGEGERGREEECGRERESKRLIEERGRKVCEREER